MPFNFKDLSEKLAKQRRAAEENDAKRRAEKLGFPYIDLVSVRVPTEIKAMAFVPEEKARKASLVPLQVVGKKLTIAAFDPKNAEAQAIVQSLKERFEVSLVVVSKSGLAHAWGYYRYIPQETKGISGKIEIDDARLRELKKEIKSLEVLAERVRSFKSSLTSQLLEIIVAGALALKASDIHLEPNEDRGVLRLRLDGLLHTVQTPLAINAYHSIMNRIKLLSGLKLNIRDEPQDGRFTIDLADTDIEVRTSIIPSEYGETAVLRILDPSALKVKLEELGFREDDLAIIKKELEKPNGLILNTGPTGSGKTTTLYAFLKHVFRPEMKIITIEDPIEYHLPDISQTQIDPEAGYTFANGLRSILRQDPDVILVGEVRDRETAEIAMNASLTGHLVFSTLHTNDAAGAIPRLIDLGAQPNIIGPALNLIIAQRLVRVLCPRCKIKKLLAGKIKEEVEAFFKQLPKRVTAPSDVIAVYEPKGCGECGNLGYRGRTSIFELISVTEKVEEMIYKNPTEIELKNLARQENMTTMQEDGIIKALAGVTSIEEVERLTGPIEWLRAGNIKK